MNYSFWAGLAVVKAAALREKTPFEAQGKQGKRAALRSSRQAALQSGREVERGTLAILVCSGAMGEDG
jgi:hypothetical protein